MKIKKGFRAGRYIRQNTTLLYDIMHITEKRHIPGLLLVVDFEKALDSMP